MSGDEGDNAGFRGRRDVPHWSQPCTDVMSVETNTPQKLSGHIVQTLSLAHSHLNNKGDNLKDKFAFEALEFSTWELMVEYINNSGVRFNFLDMPAATDVTFDAMLLYSYEKIQRVAVGIEQVTLDQALYQGKMLKDFRTMESYIVKILCNLYYAMVHQALPPAAQVTKEIMSEEYRDLEDQAHSRGVRDAAIVIKYNEAIEELSQIFQTFKEQ